jgi:hypothetical protein
MDIRPIISVLNAASALFADPVDRPANNASAITLQTIFINITIPPLWIVIQILNGMND